MHVDTRTSTPRSTPADGALQNIIRQVFMSMASYCYENIVTVECCMAAVWTCCGCFLWLWSLGGNTRCPNTRDKRFRTIIGGAGARHKRISHPWLCFCHTPLATTAAASRTSWRSIESWATRPMRIPSDYYRRRFLFIRIGHNMNESAFSDLGRALNLAGRC